MIVFPPTTILSSNTIITPMKYKKWGLILLVAAAILSFYLLGGSEYLTLESLKNNRNLLLDYTASHYLISVGLFISLYLFQTALAMPGGALMTLLGGFLFGSIAGTLYVNIGATGGAVLAFMASRYLLRQWAEQRFGDKVATIQAGLNQNAFQYLLTLRLIPVFPFFLINLLLGLSRVPLKIYTLTTALGIIPASFVYANAGKQLGNIDSVADIASVPVLLSMALLGVLPLIPVLIKKLTAKNKLDH